MATLIYSSYYNDLKFYNKKCMPCKNVSHSVQ